MDKVRKLDAMYNVALFAVKTCDRTSGCIDSEHTPCLQKKILDYFNADNDNNIPNKMGETSRFLRADIKVSCLVMKEIVKHGVRALENDNIGGDSNEYTGADFDDIREE
ncbi:DNA/RNA helicase, ATP-dependent, DEAH-box type, conserved site [Artemisia annua]|uniref:DNA/RNA helicase, ATP-dependent, DEAH-box type, conserved site n=1 Tax=Artemisia annua TaxID=35608 RepID=A0A2U1KE90_ARTAN|nr:DNA/RNA helicase, ATP-dependent, DEAH-box type, conserved site [Artemisia annua]